MKEILQDATMGNWFIPGNEESSIEGTLIKNSQGVYLLKTINLFNDVNDLRIDHIDTINGVLENGKHVTLFNCSKPKQEMNMPGYIVTQYSPLYIIVGAHYSNESEFICNEVSSDYNGLEIWLQQQPFQFYKIPNSTENHLIYKMPQNKSWNIEGKEIGFNFEASINSNKYNEFHIIQSQHVIFKDDNMSFTSLLENIYDFASFLTLCMGVKEIPNDIQAIDCKGQKVNLIENSTIRLKPLQGQKPIQFVTFSDVQNNFDTCIMNWKDKSELLLPVIQRFIAIHEQTENIITSFLNIIQALETFSRRMRAETILPQEQHEQRIERIINCLHSDNDKDWLADVLKTPILNEPSFSSRITKLFKETTFAFGVTKKSISTLAYKVASTRNYYTHFNESLKDSILSDHDIFYTITLAKYVIRVLLLKELGMSEEHIKEKISCDNEIVLALEKLNLIDKTELFNIKIIPVEQVEEKD